MDMVLINQSQVYHYRRFYQVSKRLLDVVLCLIALPIAIPLMAVCVVAIRLDSPGPALFIQDRVGKGGRLFKMYKFRTMENNLSESAKRAHCAFMKAFVNGKIGDTDAPSTNSFNMSKADGNRFRRAFLDGLSASHSESAHTEKIFKPIEDSQITRVGRFLRKTSMDELPQLFNVLKGEMSVVGPRPNVPWEVEEYQPWHYERLEVLPGITGLAQVRGRSAISFSRIVQYDIEYVEKQSLLFDFQILWLTVSSVLLGVGAK